MSKRNSVQFLRHSSLGAVLLAVAASAHATPITFTDTYIGDATYGFGFENLIYREVPITIDGTGDTSEITHQGSEYFVPVSTVTITVGISDFAALVFSVIDPVEVFVDNQGDAAGFTNVSAVGGIETEGFVIGPRGPVETNAFSTYDLSTTLTAMGTPAYDGAFLTSAGEYFLTVPGPYYGESTFSAVTSSSDASTPEPGTMALIGGGLALVMIGRRRRVSCALPPEI